MEFKPRASKGINKIGDLYNDNAVIDKAFSNYATYLTHLAYTSKVKA